MGSTINPTAERKSDYIRGTNRARRSDASVYVIRRVARVRRESMTNNLTLVGTFKKLREKNVAPDTGGSLLSFPKFA